jgi:hypothetical protein
VKPTAKRKRGTSRQSAFLAAFSITGRVAHAAKACKIEREMHYRWIKEDPAYPALFADAKAKAVQCWEDEAVRRANDGVFEPNTYKGDFVYPITGYRLNEETGKPDYNLPIYGKKPLGVMKSSDRLLEFLLRGAKPETYREARTVELTGAGGGPIALQLVERLNAGRQRIAKTAPTNDAPKPDESSS